MPRRRGSGSANGRNSCGENESSDWSLAFGLTDFGGCRCADRCADFASGHSQLLNGDSGLDGNYHPDDLRHPFVVQLLLTSRLPRAELGGMEVHLTTSRPDSSGPPIGELGQMYF